MLFKHLRKTFITAVNHFTKGKAEIITGHSDQEIKMKNYDVKKVFYEVYYDFRMKIEL
jgi:hypothetical protein